MNIFSGSRRVAVVVAILWAIGWLIAAVVHETKVYARYDFVVGNNYANFAGFDLYSCPQNTDLRSLDIKTETGRPIQVTLCIVGSHINVPKGFVLEPFDPDVYLAKKQTEQVEWDDNVSPNTIKVFFADGTSHIYQNVREKTTTDKVMQRVKKDFPQKVPAKIAGQGADWVDLEALAKRFGGVIVTPKTNETEKEGPWTKYQSNKGNPFDIFDESKLDAAFKIRKEDQIRLNEKWWESWRSAYGQGLAIMIGGFAALWIFSLAMGWIIRGFLGIPHGMDSRP